MILLARQRPTKVPRNGRPCPWIARVIPRFSPESVDASCVGDGKAGTRLMQKDTAALGIELLYFRNELCVFVYLFTCLK